MNEPVASTIMATIANVENANENLKRRSTLGASMKKLENSSSFAVAPQVMLISNMCANSAWETWRERPPRKIPSRKTHLKFSKTTVFGLPLVLLVMETLIEGILTGIEKSPFANAISHDCQRDVSKKVEYNDNRKPNFPRINIVFVEITVKPSDSKIIRCRHDPRSANSVVSPNIRDNSDFGSHSNIRE